MPSGTKMTQTDSDAKLRWFLDRNWLMVLIDKLKDSGTNCRGSKMGSCVGNDQNALLHDFMQKLE